MNEMECTWYLLEDDPDDVELLSEAIEASGFPIKLIHFYAHDVFLREIKNCIQPAIIILDINLPNGSGMDILASIKKDPELKDLTVVMFTSSNMERFREQSKELGAISYITKPYQLVKYQEIIGEIFALCQQK